MKIACLGWGSLVWNPDKLPVRRDWFSDGPLLPIEFSRCSDDKRITLVIDSEAEPVRVLWAIFSVDDLDSAIESLRVREKVKSHNVIRDIGVWRKDHATRDALRVTIGTWAKQLGLDAVLWTALTHKHPQGSVKTRPSSTDVIRHLKDLKKQRKHVEAEKYIRLAPTQIDTDYRRAIEKALRWTPQRAKSDTVYKEKLK